MRKTETLLLLLTLAIAVVGDGCRQSNVVSSPPPAVIRAPVNNLPGPNLSGSTMTPVVPESVRRLPVEWVPSSGTREWTSIVIHHTASKRGSVESINDAHLQKKDSSGNSWLGIGYHFVIGNGDGMGDGEIEPTFRWREQMHGAHAGDNDFNQHGIGIVLVGNFEETPPSAAQLASVKRLVGVLRAEYEIPSDKVVGHRDVKATACPGKFFPMTEVSRSWGDATFGQSEQPGSTATVARNESQKD